MNAEENYNENELTNPDIDDSFEDEFMDQDQPSTTNSDSTDMSRSSDNKSSADNKSSKNTDANKNSSKEKSDKTEPTKEAKSKQYDSSKVDKVNKNTKNSHKGSKLKDPGSRSVGKRIRDRAKKKANNAVDAIKNSAFFQRLKKMFDIVKKTIKFVINNAKLIAILSTVFTIVGGLVLTIISISEAAGKSPHYYCPLEPDKYTQKTALYKQYCGGHGSLNFSSIKCIFAVEIGWIIANYEQHIMYSLDDNSDDLTFLKEWDPTTSSEDNPSIKEDHWICCASFVTICLYKAGIIEGNQVGAGCNAPREAMNKRYALYFSGNDESSATIRECNDGWVYVGGLCKASGSLGISTDEFVEKYIDGGELHPGDVILYRHSNSDCTNDKHDHVTLVLGRPEDTGTETSINMVDPRLSGHWCELEACMNKTNGHGHDSYNNTPGVLYDKSNGGTNWEVSCSPIDVSTERTVEVWRYVGE